MLDIKWIRENPFGKGTGWEPYPTSLRIINWIKWHFKTNSLSAEAKLSLWNQLNWLSGRPEFHLLGHRSDSRILRLSTGEAATAAGRRTDR